MPRSSQPDSSPLWFTGFLLGMALALRPPRRPLVPPDRGRPLDRTGPHDAPAVTTPPGRWAALKEIGFCVYREMSQDRLIAVAAGIVFYALLALFPAITALVSSYALFTKASTISDHLSTISGFLPAGAYDIVQEQVGRIVDKGDATLSLGFIFGLALAIWSANAGMKAMMDGLNVVYDVDEKRGFIRLNLVSLTMTVGTLAFVLVLIGVLVGFPLAMKFIGLEAWTETILRWSRWPVIVLLLLLALATLYRFGPSPRGAKWRWISPGAVVATVTWLISSALLSWYLANFANYNATYGSLGAAIGLMMWMWVSSIVVLVGAQLNAVLEQRAARAGAPDSLSAATAATPREAAAA
ncbi:MAG TPA: YihY/virulence factor BrkB family protein [Stellaceae bacterium]|jgi:membrane protein|nr:YihY/virulence factor BrkB family protein [Stellaceae bacterium]